MQYIHIRVRKDTQHKRKVLSALLDESMLDTVDRLITAEVFYRLDNAMKAFFRRLEAGEKPGFPRVRPQHCFFTLCSPAMYLKIKGNTLILPTGGRGKNKKYPNVEAQLAELPPEGFGAVAIRRDGRSNYYASFSYRAEPARPQQGQVVAFDLGVWWETFLVVNVVYLQHEYTRVYNHPHLGTNVTDAQAHCCYEQRKYGQGDGSLGKAGARATQEARGER
jgi:hypothetical protein